MSRKLKLQVQISIDGLIAGPNGEMDFFTWNWGNDIKNYITELTDLIDIILLGRKFAEGFILHWKNIANDSNNPEYAAGKIFTETPKIIFTKTLEKSNWENTALAKGNLADEINLLKNKSGKDLIAYGGAEFVSNLIKEGLIDELHLFVNPVAVGKGMPIFANLKDKQDFKLIKSQAFDCGINVLVYKLKSN